MAELSPGEIYFVREVDPNNSELSPFVKIGLVNESEGRNSYDRLLDHQTGNPRTLILHNDQVIKTLAVSRVESMLHSKYVDLRISGEWFEFVDADAIEVAFSFAQDLASQVDQEAETVNKAKALANQVDNGNLLSATPEIEKLATASLLAKEEANRVKAIQNFILSSMREAKEAGIDVTSAVDERVVTRSTFDLEALKLGNPDVYARYSYNESKVTGPFRYDTKFKMTVLLSAEVEQGFQAIVDNLETLISAKEIKKINEIKLQLISRSTELAWQIDVLDAKLRVLVGPNRGIDGICSWARVTKTEEKFGNKKFKLENPDLFEQFSSESEPSSHLRAKREKA